MVRLPEKTDELMDEQRRAADPEDADPKLYWRDVDQLRQELAPPSVPVRVPPEEQRVIHTADAGGSDVMRPPEVSPEPQRSLLDEMRAVRDGQEPAPPEPEVGTSPLAKTLEQDGTLRDLEARQTIERRSTEDQAQRDSSKALFGEWDKLDDKGRAEWIKGEKEYAQSTGAWWSSLKDNLVDSRRRMIERAGGNPDEDLLQPWLDRKVKEQIAFHKQRREAADLMEQGLKEGPQTGTMRLLADTTGHGVVDGVVANMLKGMAYAGAAWESVKGYDFYAADDQSPLKIDATPFGKVEERALYKVGKDVSDWAEAAFPKDKARSTEFKAQFGEGLGSMVGFMGPTVAMSLARAGLQKAGVSYLPEIIAAVNSPGISAGVTGALTQGGSMTDDALKAYKGGKTVDGHTVDENDLLAAFLLSLPIGATEAAPIAHLFAGQKGQWVKRIFAQAYEEGGQEFVQQVAENFTARAFYDDKRMWDDNAWDGALIGGLLGAKSQVIADTYRWAKGQEQEGADAAVGSRQSAVREARVRGQQRIIRDVEPVAAEEPTAAAAAPKPGEAAASTGLDLTQFYPKGEAPQEVTDNKAGSGEVRSPGEPSVAITEPGARDEGRSEARIAAMIRKPQADLGPLVDQVASAAHDDWRQPRKVEGSESYEPRLKPVTDRAWIKAHGGRTSVDIANTPYADLPAEWQAENKASAEMAVRAVDAAERGGSQFDGPFIERTAAAIHDGWVKRNGEWASPELKKPYEELPEDEKQKDRLFVQRAVDAARASRMEPWQAELSKKLAEIAKPLTPDKAAVLEKDVTDNLAGYHADIEEAYTSNGLDSAELADEDVRAIAFHMAQGLTAEEAIERHAIQAFQEASQGRQGEAAAAGGGEASASPGPSGRARGQGRGEARGQAPASTAGSDTGGAREGSRAAEGVGGAGERSQRAGEATAAGQSERGAEQTPADREFERHLRARFSAILASARPRREWAKALGIRNPEQHIETLVNEALRDGKLIRDRNGVIRRTPLAKVTPRETPTRPVEQSLAIPPDLRASEAVRRREAETDRPVSQLVRAWAVNIEEARGNPAVFAEQVRLLKDAAKSGQMTLADMRELAAIAGYRNVESKGKKIPLSRMSKAGAIAAIQKRHDDLVKFQRSQATKAGVSQELAALAGVAEDGRAQKRAFDRLGFYSKALEEAKNLKQEKGTPEQFLSMLRKAGVKEAEIKATGLDKFLIKASEPSAAPLEKFTPASQQNAPAKAEEGRFAAEAGKPVSRPKTLTKSAIVQYLEENRVEVREKVYRNGEPVQFVAAADGSEATDVFAPSGDDRLATLSPQGDGQVLVEYANGASMVVSSMEEAQDLFATTAKWSQYSLGGREDPTYQERVLHLGHPPRFHAIEARQREITQRSGEIARELDRLDQPAVNRSRGERATADSHPLQQEWQRLFDEQQALQQERDSLRGFRDGHFENEPNPIVNTGTSIQKDADGKAVGVLDRFQPQWAQNIRDARRNAWARKLFGPESEYAKKIIPEVEKRIQELADQHAHEVATFPRQPAGHVFAGLIRADHGERFNRTIEEHRLAEVELAALKRGVTFRDLPKDQKSQVSQAISQEQKEGGSIAGVRDEGKIAELEKRVNDLKVKWVDNKELTQIHAEAQDLTHEAYPDGILPPNTRLGLNIRRASNQWEALQSLAEDSTKSEDLRERASELRLKRNEIDGMYEPTIRMLEAELRTAERESLGHPLVNTTDQVLETGLRRVIRQFIEAGVEHIAITPGDVLVARGEGRTDNPEAMRNWMDVMVPRALLKELRKHDPSIQREEKTLNSSVDGRLFTHKGEEGRFVGETGSRSHAPILFHSFPLTDKVKASVMMEGQALFSLAGYTGRDLGQPALGRRPEGETGGRAAPAQRPSGQARVQDSSLAAELASREAAARAVMDGPAWQAAGESLADPSLYTYNQKGYGTPQWEAARRHVALDGSEIVGTRAAAEYLADEAEKAVPGGVGRDKQAYLVIGYPGAGKSTIAKAVSQQFRAAHMVADLAKEVIPEYEGGKGGERVHEESKALGANAASVLVARGDNIILETLGQTEAAVEGRARWLKREGYSVALVHMDVPKAVAMERAVARFQRSGRAIPASIYDTLNAGDTYARAKASGEIDETATVRWDEASQSWQLAESTDTLRQLQDALPAGRPADATPDSQGLGGPGGPRHALGPNGPGANQGGPGLGTTDRNGRTQGPGDQALFALASRPFTPAFQQHLPAFATELERQLRNVLGDDVAIRMADRLFFAGPERARAMKESGYLPIVYEWGRVRNNKELAERVRAQGPGAMLVHEVVETPSWLTENKWLMAIALEDGFQTALEKSFHGAAHIVRGKSMVLSDLLRNQGKAPKDIISALHQRGLWSDADWAILVERANKLGMAERLAGAEAVIEGAVVPDRLQAYRDRYMAALPQAMPLAQRQAIVDENIDQELVSSMVEDFVAGRASFGAKIDSLLARIARFFQALRNALVHGGFTTADDILQQAFGKDLREGTRGQQEPQFDPKAWPTPHEAILASPVGEDSMRSMGLMAITAYHGSPHDFDKFSLEHIGRGEGAQAYGPGLYFAESKSVARNYTRAGSASVMPRALVMFDGEELSASPASPKNKARLEEAEAAVKALGYNERDHQDLDRLAERIRKKTNSKYGVPVATVARNFFNDHTYYTAGQKFYPSAFPQNRGSGMANSWASDITIRPQKDGTKRLYFDDDINRGRYDWLEVDAKGMITKARGRFILDKGTPLDELIGWREAHSVLAKPKGKLGTRTIALGSPNEYSYNYPTPRLAAARALDEAKGSRESAVALQESGIDKLRSELESFSKLNPFNREDRAQTALKLDHAQDVLAALKEGREEEGIPWHKFIGDLEAFEAKRLEQKRLQRVIDEFGAFTGEDHRFESGWLSADGWAELEGYKSLKSFEKAHEEAAEIADDAAGYSNADLHARENQAHSDMGYSIALAIRELRRLQDEGRIKWAPLPKEGQRFQGLYRVQLHVEPDELLHWDVALEKQPDGVKEKLRKAYGASLGGAAGKTSILSWLFPRAARVVTTGAQFVRKQGNNEELRQTLLAAGIPGIRYLDGFSRKKNEGTYNYVIFDDSRIEITHKNGEAVTKEERADIVEGMKHQPSPGREGMVSEQASDWTGFGEDTSDHPGQALFALAGAKAKTAPLSSRNLAESMERKGRKPEQIYKDTGWFRGPDQMWRFEIDDSAARVVNLDAHLKAPANTLFRSLVGMKAKGQPKWAKGKVRVGTNIPLDALLSHKKLFDAYPFLRQMKANIVVGPGVPVQVEGKLMFREGGGKISYSPIAVRAKSETDVLPALMHEIQHYIQRKEGFSGGSSPSTSGEIATKPLDFKSEGKAPIKVKGASFSPTTNEALAGDWRSEIAGMTRAELLAKRLSDTWNEYERDGHVAFGPGTRVEDWPRLTREKIAGMQAQLMNLLRVTEADYATAAGEREAMTVMARLNMTPEQRRASLPKVEGRPSTLETADFRDAADEVARSGAQTQAIRDKWAEPKEIAPHIWASRPEENHATFWHRDREGWGGQLDAALDPQHGVAVLRLTTEGPSIIDRAHSTAAIYLRHRTEWKGSSKQFARENAIRDLEQQDREWREKFPNIEAEYGAAAALLRSGKPINQPEEVFFGLPKAEQARLVDAAEKYLRDMNLMPTADIRLMPAWAQGSFVPGPESRHAVLSDAEFAFWRSRDPLFMADDIRGYMPEILAAAKRQYGADVTIFVQDKNNPIVQVVDKNGKVLIGGIEGGFDVTTVTEIPTPAPIPAELKAAGLDEEIWKIRTPELHEAGEDAGFKIEPPISLNPPYYPKSMMITGRTEFGEPTFNLDLVGDYLRGHANTIRDPKIRAEVEALARKPRTNFFDTLELKVPASQAAINELVRLTETYHERSGGPTTLASLAGPAPEPQPFAVNIPGYRGEVIERTTDKGDRIRTYNVYQATDDNGSGEGIAPDNRVAINDPSQQAQSTGDREGGPAGRREGSLNQASLVVSEQSDGSWELSFFKPGAQKGLVAQVVASVESEVGNRLSPSGWLTPESYRYWQQAAPAKVAQHQDAGPLFDGMYASPKAVQLAEAVLSEASSRSAGLTSDSFRGVNFSNGEPSTNDALIKTTRQLARLRELSSSVSQPTELASLASWIGGPFERVADILKAKYMGLGYPGESAISGQVAAMLGADSSVRSAAHPSERALAGATRDHLATITATVNRIRSGIAELESAPVPNAIAIKHFEGFLAQAVERLRRQEWLVAQAEEYEADQRDEIEQGLGAPANEPGSPQDKARVDRFRNALEGPGRPPLRVIEGGKSESGEGSPQLLASLAGGPRDTSTRIEPRFSREQSSPTYDPQAQGLGQAPRSLTTIIADLKEALGMPVTQGLVGITVRNPVTGWSRRIRPGANVAGQYQTFTQQGVTRMGVARVRQSADIETIAHEGGHHLENVIGDPLKRLIATHAAELGPYAGGVASVANAADEGWLSEGFAEWFREFVLDPERAAIRAPAFHEAFGDLLDGERPDILTGLDSLQIATLSKDYQNYQKATVIERGMADVATWQNPTTWQQIKEFYQSSNKAETISQWFSTLSFAFTDKANPILLTQQALMRLADANGVRDAHGRPISLQPGENAYRIARLLARADKIGHQMLLNGVPDYDGLEGIGPSFHAAVTEAMGGTSRFAWTDQALKRFGLYLEARRAVVEWARHLDGELERPPTRKSAEEYLQIIDEIEAANPSYKRAAQMVYDFQHRLLTLEWQAGKWTDEAYTALSARKDFYVPFLRDMSDVAPLTGAPPATQMSRRFTEARAFKGSDRNIVNPLEAIAKRAYQTAAALQFNDMVKALTGLSERVGLGGAGFIERVAEQEVLANNERTFARIKDIAVRSGMDEADAHLLVQQMEMNFADADVHLLWDPDNLGPMRPPTVPLWEKGERKLVRLNDPVMGRRLFEAMNALGREQANFLIKAISYPAAVLRAGVTMHPAFVLSNILGDMTAAWTLTGSITRPASYPLVTQARGLYHLLASNPTVRASLAKVGITPSDISELYSRVGGISGGQNVAALRAVHKDFDLRELRSKGYHVLNLQAAGGLATTIVGTAAGGLVGGVVGATAGAAAGAMLGRLVFGQGAEAAFAQLSELSETITRLGVASYALKRAKRLNPAISDIDAIREAAFTASDVLDFDRNGAKAGTLMKLIPFFNANLQGVSKAYRQVLVLDGERGKANMGKVRLFLRWQLAAGAGGAAMRQAMSPRDQQAVADGSRAWVNLMVLAAVGAAIFLVHKDDPEYDDVGEDTKATHFVFKLYGTWYRIKKPFELATPANIVQTMMEWWIKNDPRVWSKIKDGLIQTHVPPYLPQTLRVWADLKSGIDTRNDRPIVRQALSRLPAYMQFDAYSSEFAIQWAKTLHAMGVDVAPQKIDFALNGTLGYWGREIQVSSNYFLGKNREAPKWTDEPIIGTMINRVTLDPSRRSASVEEFWKAMGQGKGRFDQAKAGYDEALRSGNGESVKAYLAGLPEEERLYAVLGKHFKAKEQEAHPLNRARAIMSIDNAMRREMILDRLVDSTIKSQPEKIALAPAKKTEIHDILGRLSAIETWNGLHDIGTPGWSKREVRNPQIVLDEFKAASPVVYEEMMRRRAKAHVGTYADDQEKWAGVKERVEELIRDEDMLGLAWNKTVRKRRAPTPSLEMPTPSPTPSFRFQMPGPATIQ